MMETDFFEQEINADSFDIGQNFPDNKAIGKNAVCGIDEFNLYLEDRISQFEKADSDFFGIGKKKAKTQLGRIFRIYVIPALVIWRVCLFTADYFTESKNQKSEAPYERNSTEYRIYVVHENSSFAENLSSDFSEKTDIKKY